ncbi:hypothetical protein V9T40_013789 [Parthenolecanium corni]|uniref:Uncharacterized protein n=1 Tax=Parthenolecanium corni TaxID=536013 RepID=A0AAN9TSS4_9HEMI
MPFIDETFSVDERKILNWNNQPVKIRVNFDFETSFNTVEHEAYPCYAKHSNNKSTLNRTYLNMFVISSGPHEDTIFVFSYLGNENNYMIRSFIANVNFNHFRPITDLIFYPYKPNPTGPSDPSGSSRSYVPFLPHAPSQHFRSSGPFASSTLLLPSRPPRPPRHYPTPGPSASYVPPVDSAPSGQYSFSTHSTSTPSMFSQPPESSAQQYAYYKFPVLESFEPSSSYTPLVPAEPPASSKKSKHSGPSN